jgi:hypothetical protein
LSCQICQAFSSVVGLRLDRREPEAVDVETLLDRLDDDLADVLAVVLERLGEQLAVAGRDEPPALAPE